MLNNLTDLRKRNSKLALEKAGKQSQFTLHIPSKAQKQKEIGNKDEVRRKGEDSYTSLPQKQIEVSFFAERQIVSLDWRTPSTTVCWHAELKMRSNGKFHTEGYNRLLPSPISPRRHWQQVGDSKSTLRSQTRLREKT